MTEVGTEGLPMFTTTRLHPDMDLEFTVPLRPKEPMVGAALKAHALADHAESRAHDIAKVRVALLAGARMAESRFLTADDASVVVERLGMSTGKWLGTIFRHWDAVEPTGQFIKSTLPRSRARRIAVWAIK